MTITATRPAAPVTTTPAAAPSPAVTRPAEDTKEQARRALQVSLDTRQ
ncbi:hypothetical protein ACIA8K_21105 [Catenuloplanes sp. NPDC051500]